MAVQFLSHWRLNYFTLTQTGFTTSATSPGETVVAVITMWVNSGSPPAISAPEGFVLAQTVDPIGSGGRYVARAYWKRVTDDEPTNWIFTHPSILRSAWAVRASGVVAAGDPWRGFDFTSGEGTASPALSVDDVEQGDGLIIGASQDVENTEPFTPPSGFTPWWWGNWDYYAARDDAPADSAEGLQIVGNSASNLWVTFLGALRAEPDEPQTGERDAASHTATIASHADRAGAGARRITSHTGMVASRAERTGTGVRDARSHIARVAARADRAGVGHRDATSHTGTIASRASWTDQPPAPTPDHLTLAWLPDEQLTLAWLLED